MNSFCTDLKISVTPLINDVSTYGTKPHVLVPVNELHPELHEFFKQHNLKVLLAELFYNKPSRMSQIHVDWTGGDYSKVNFIWGGEDSLMCWYNIKDGVKKSTNTTYLNTKSINFSSSEVTLVHKQSVNFPSIVQVGVPHNIFNPKTPRWCLSIVITKVSGQRLTMAETLEIFKDNI